MYEIPGQHSNDVIRHRRRGLKRAFHKSWRNWRRLIDILDLLKFNRSFRRGVKSSLKDIKAILGRGRLKNSG